MSDNTELKNKIESAWENITKISPKDTDIADAVNAVSYTHLTLPTK